MIGRRTVLAGLLAGGASGRLWAEGTAPRPRPALAAPVVATNSDRTESLIAEAGLGGTLGFAVARQGAAGVLDSRNAGAALPPASVAKVVTTLYALDRLGPDHRFVTRVMATGPVRGGRLEGDLLLVGGGDPGLDTDRLGDLVAALAATGLRGVAGRFIAIDGALPFRDRLVSDQPEHVGYNPAISGLNLNYNRVHFEWAPGGEVLTMEARGERFRVPVSAATMRMANREAPLFSYARQGDADRWTVAASALAKGGSRWLPVRDPAAYAAEAFAGLAAARGIRLPKARVQPALPPGATELVAQKGEPLTEVLRGMLRHSTNLTAEAVGLTASGGPSLPASGAAMTDWARAAFGVRVRHADHSGLNAASRVTAADMLAVLQGAANLRHGALLEGLMRERGLDAEAGETAAAGPFTVHAKSGTMNFVSGLAGFVRRGEGPALAFAIFAADTARREAVPLAERERPPGLRSWLRRARDLQGALITDWASRWL